MEKKVIKKVAAKKKTAVVKEIELKDAIIAGAAKPVRKRAVKAPESVKKSAKEIVLKAKATAVATSPVKRIVQRAAKKATLDVTSQIAAADPKVELSPVFKSLADPVLPVLTRENRARLQMQTPTRLYFYWSIKENPYHLLKQVFGNDTGSYTLVLKLTNTRRNSEEIHPTDAAGNWWFDVEPDGEYQAEIGFYAPNRPYFRVIYSNTVETPRRSPSPHPASEANWTVSANKFAEVLDVAGFSRDAFDVAMAGDDHVAAENTSHAAFSSFLGTSRRELHGITAEDIRYVMLALASGASAEDLRFRVSTSLFAILQANADKLEAKKAMSVLTTYFDIDEAEFTEEQLDSPVFGASLIHFPKTLKTKKVSSAFSPRYNPVSSHSFR